MTRAERIAFALGERFPELDAAAMSEHPAFLQAVAAALTIADERAIVEQVAALGGLAGARNVHAVIVGRLRELPQLAEDRRRLADEESEARRWVAVDRAAKRGETLRALVERGDIFADEAADVLAREFSDDDLRSIADAALSRGGS